MPETPTSYPPLSAHWDGLTIIARGANRLCVQSPDDPRHCLKFELPPAERTTVGARQAFRRWLARQVPFFGENRTELRAYRRLRTRLGNATDGAIAACRDIVATPWGDALRCEMVRDADGTLARSLYAHLFEDTDRTADALCTAVDGIEDWLLAHAVPLFDLNAGNFVVAGTAGQPRLICIDAKSTLSGKEILPLSRWFPCLMRRKIQRRAARLRQRIRAALPTPAALADTPPPH